MAMVLIEIPTKNAIAMSFLCIGAMLGKFREKETLFLPLPHYEYLIITIPIGIGTIQAKSYI